MSDSILILSVDTATTGGGVCLMEGDQARSSIAGESTLSHSNTLLRDIQTVLEEADVKLEKIDLFAVASGPGSFTGLRIGIATIKALAATLEKPCIGVPTLHAVARSAGPSKNTIALLPAGRGELFAQLFSVGPTGEVTELDQPAHIPPAGVFERYSHLDDPLWAGIGAHAQLESLAEYALSRDIDFDEISTSNYRFRLAKLSGNLAVEVALLARDRHMQGQDEAADELRAIYVRPSDPELKHARV